MSSIVTLLCKFPFILIDVLFFSFSPARIVWCLLKRQSIFHEEEGTWLMSWWFFLGLLSWIAVIILGSRLIYFINH